MPTYRSLGNDLYEIDGPGGRRIPVRLAPGQLEAAGYTPEPEPMGGLEGAAYTPQAMPSPQAFAGPGAAGPKMELSTSPLRVETESGSALGGAERPMELTTEPLMRVRSAGPTQTAGGGPEAKAVQQLLSPGPSGLDVVPVERAPSGVPASVRVPEASSIEKITGISTPTPGIRKPWDTWDKAQETKVKTTGDMPGIGGEEETATGKLPVFIRGGGGGGRGTAPGTLTPGKEEIEFTRQDPEALERWKIAKAEQSQDIAARLLRTSQQHTKYAETLRKEAKDEGDLGKMQRARYNDALADFERERASIAAEQIDPGKYYSDRGVVGTIFAAIMRGAGEWAATRDRSGRNPVAQIIDNGIDREIDAQKANHAARLQGLSTKMTILDRYMQNNDPKDAEAMARANLKEAWVHQLEATGNEAALAEVQSSARADIAELEAKAGMQKVTTTLVAPKATGGGGGGGIPFQALVNATGYSPEQALAYAQADPAGARKIAMQYLETQATARGKSEGGPGTHRPYATEAAKNLSLAEQLEKQTAFLEQAYRKEGRTAVVKAMTPGTELYDARVKAAEAIGRLHSGAAITKVEEERFAGMMGGKRHLIGGGDLAAKSVAQVRAEARAMIEKLRKAPSEPGYPERPPPTSM